MTVPEVWRTNLALAISQVERERRIFLEHQEAWRINNHWHGREIERLRRALRSILELSAAEAHYAAEIARHTLESQESIDES